MLSWSLLEIWGEAGHKKKKSYFQVEISFTFYRKLCLMQLSQLIFWI